MGVYFSVHVGPVLVCKYHMNETVEKRTVNFIGCPSADCKFHNPKHKLSAETKFCPKCGTPTQSLTKEKTHTSEKKSASFYDLMEQGDIPEDIFVDCWGGVNCEELVPGHDLLAPMSNTFNTFLGRRTSLVTNTFAIHARAVDPKAEIAKLEEFFAKEIAYLRTKYDSVSVEWMVLTTGK